jgi:splicing factor 3B subunit 1
VLAFQLFWTHINYCSSLIADHSAEFVPAHEWMCICFKLLDLLKAHKKGIHCAAVNSFGYIAKSLGPQDVLSILLTNF